MADFDPIVTIYLFCFISITYEIIGKLPFRYAKNFIAISLV